MANTLTIVRLNNDVAGNYTCLASNDVGTITSAVAEIRMAGKLGLVATCVHIRKIIYLEVEKWPGYNARLICQ